MLKFFKKKTYESELEDLDKEYGNNPERLKMPAYILRKADIDKKYNKIDDYQYDETVIQASAAFKSVEEKEEELLKNKLKHKKIEPLDYEKAINDLHQNPWAKVHFNYDESNDPTNIQTEIVYNDYFIKKLIKQGYSGDSNEAIIQSWLSQVFASNIDEGDLIQNVSDSSNNKFVKTQVIEGKKIVG